MLNREKKQYSGDFLRIETLETLRDACEGHIGIILYPDGEEFPLRSNVVKILDKHFDEYLDLYLVFKKSNIHLTKIEVFVSFILNLDKHNF